MKEPWHSHVTLDKLKIKMASHLTFNGNYLNFESYLPPYQRADDVGYAVTEFLWSNGRPFYPIGALADAKVTYVGLRATNGDEADEDNLDLIFRMHRCDGGFFFEIVLRSNQGTSYSGRLWGNDIEVLDDTAGGYRVIVTKWNSACLRFEYDTAQGQYIHVSRPV